jgi:hypothetical protein
MRLIPIGLLIGIVVAVLAVGGLAKVLGDVRSLMAPVPLKIRYATVQTAMPEDAKCAGADGERPAIAKEILNLKTHEIFVAGGSRPMPDDVWTRYRFRLPFLKNSTRHLLFTESCFFRSPGVPVDCTGEDCFDIHEIAGYTWLKLTEVVGQTCFPDASGSYRDVVKPGYISINTIAKCHRMVFPGPTIYELADGKGNKYVMHATATGKPDVTGPTLPTGWTLTERTITEPLVLLPFGGGDQCYYNVVRDNLVQSYHQYVYADDHYPPTPSK